MVGSQEEAVEARKVGYHANLVKTTKREQNPVVVKMLLRELSKDADLLVLRVKPIKEGEDEMTWKDVLKAHCGTEKQEMEKLVGNQKRIDADKDGKITGKDFAMLREKSGDNFEKFFRRKEQTPDIQSDGIKFSNQGDLDYFNQLKGRLGTRAQFMIDYIKRQIGNRFAGRQNIDRGYQQAMKKNVIATARPKSAGMTAEEYNRMAGKGMYKSLKDILDEDPEEMLDFMNISPRMKRQKMMRQILKEIEKEGGALGMKNLKKFGKESEIKSVLAELEKEGKIFMHEDGDIYTHEPKR